MLFFLRPNKPNTSAQGLISWPARTNAFDAWACLRPKPWPCISARHSRAGQGGFPKLIYMYKYIGMTLKLYVMYSVRAMMADGQNPMTKYRS